MSVLTHRRDGRANSLDHALAPVLPVLIVVLGLATLAEVLRAAAIVPLHVPLDPNEGWDAYRAVAAIAGRGLYPNAASFLTNNYPPLSFYFVGFLGVVVGDDIVAGRAISLVAFLCVCGFSAAAMRRMGGSWKAAAFAALLLAIILLLTSDYVGMNDPQLLGHAIQLVGLLVLLRQPSTPGAILACAGLFLLGGFVKHNLFALPLACLAWLMLTDRRNALWFALCVGVLTFFGLLVFRVIYGFDLLDRLDVPRTWSSPQMRETFFEWLAIGAVPICATAVLALRQWNDRHAFLVALYAAIAVVCGALLLGGAGVDVNAMFDADIALALGVGIALDRLLRGRRPLTHIVGRALALASVVPLAAIAGTDHDWRDGAFWLHPMRDETELAARDIAFLRTHGGPAMCEDLGFCYWAGKPAEVDVFNLDQQLATHTRDSGPFLRLIAARQFSAIELDETAPFPLPPDVQAAIRRAYRIDHTDDEGVFFVPR
jgi:hypothetical protein